MVNTNKKICIITGTRARLWTSDGLLMVSKNSKILEKQLLVTGMHLSPEYGMTINEIKKDGFKITKTVEMLLSSDTPVGK